MNNHLSEGRAASHTQAWSKSIPLGDREPGGSEVPGGNVLDVLENLQVEGHRRKYER